MNSFGINWELYTSNYEINEMRYLFLIVTLFSLGSVNAQTGLKLYGFSQSFTPGNVPVEMDGEGTTAKRPHSRTNYFVYISVPSKETIQVKEIRIGQQWYKPLYVNLVKTPVFTEQPSKKTLIPATTNKVFEIQMGDSSKLVRKLFLTKEMSRAELVVIYSWKGSDHMVAQKKWTILPPVLGL